MSDVYETVPILHSEYGSTILVIQDPAYYSFDELTLNLPSILHARKIDYTCLFPIPSGRLQVDKTSVPYLGLAAPWFKPEPGIGPYQRLGP